MSKLRVLQVTESAGGGVLRHLQHISRVLDPQKFDVTFALSPHRTEDPDALNELGEVVIVPMLRRPAPISDAIALWRLTKLMKGYDIVHLHSSKAGFLGRLAAHFAGVKKVYYTPHAFAFLRGGILGTIYFIFEKIASRFGGIIVAVSESELHAAVRVRFMKDAVLIPNPVEMRPPFTVAERDHARARLRLPQNHFVVGSIGRMVEQKDPLCFVQTAREIIHRNDLIRPVFVGGGPLENNIKDAALRLGVAGRITFAGHHRNAASLMPAFDAYIQTSRWEGMPYALLDAMAAGLPVVATNVPGNNDLIEHGTNGLLVQPGDFTGMANAVLRLAADAALRRKLGIAGQAYVAKNHTFADFSQNLEQLYLSE